MRTRISTLAMLLKVGIFSAFFCGYASRAYAQSAAPITIGVPAFSRDENFLTTAHPVGFFVQRFVGRPLAVPEHREGKGTASIRLVLSDNLSIDNEAKRWSFRVRRLAQFENGREIRGQDIQQSLERCRGAGKLSSVVKSEMRTERGSSEGAFEWIDLSLNAGEDMSRLYVIVPQELAACPILESRSAELFGKSFGVGTNLIGSGLLQLGSYHAGRELEFVLPRFDLSSQKASQNMVVRAISESAQGLTSLRSGTLDMLITADSGVLEKAQHDETLRVVPCAALDRFTHSSFRVVTRKGLRLLCEPEFDVAAIRYENVSVG